MQGGPYELVQNTSVMVQLNDCQASGFKRCWRCHTLARRSGVGTKRNRYEVDGKRDGRAIDLCESKESVQQRIDHASADTVDCSDGLIVGLGHSHPQPTLYRRVR